jgi:hypothetical protein
MDQDLEEMDQWDVDLVPVVEIVPIIVPVVGLDEEVGLVAAGLDEVGLVEGDFPLIHRKMKLPTWNKKDLFWKSDWKN